MPARRHKTRKTWNEPGHAHELTFTCYHRFKFLSKQRTCEWFIEALSLARKQWPIEIWAYVIMPEHAHLLLWPHGECDVSTILKTIKQSVARKAVAHLRSSAPEWLDRIQVTRPTGRIEHRFWQQGGGYDRNMWKEDAVWRSIDYLHDNPVRRGLCESPTDWEWSSARWYAGEDNVRLTIDGPPPDPPLHIRRRGGPPI